MYYRELKTAWAELTAPGAPFEIETIEVRGTDPQLQECAAERPRALALDRAFADRDYLVYQDERITYARGARAGERDRQLAVRPRA